VENALAKKVLDEGDNVTSDFCCQLNKRKCGKAPENKIEHYIEQRAHVSVSSRERSIPHTTTGELCKRGMALVANEFLTETHKNMTPIKNSAAVSLGGRGGKETAVWTPGGLSPVRIQSLSVGERVYPSNVDQAASSLLV
jgi:hypothetical protein